jgi:CheY-like chemotaxis protein
MDALTAGCRDLELQVEDFTDGFAAAFALLFNWNEDVPDLLIVDLDIWPHDGLGVCESIVRRESPGLIPLVLLAGKLDRATRQRCDELGACYVRKTGDVWKQLRPLLVKLLELDSAGAYEDDEPTPDWGGSNGRSRRPSVLCIDDDHLFTEVMHRRLSRQGIQVSRAFSGLQGYWKALKERPDVILTDYAMPEGYASYVLRRLKDHSLTMDIPVIVITGRDLNGRPSASKDISLERQLLGQGAACVLSKPVDHDALLREIGRHIPIRVASGAQPCVPVS